MAGDNGASAKVLVVDDNSAVLTTLTSLLQSANYTVFSSDAAEPAIATAEAEKPEIVLLDWMLPDMNGPEAVSHLRAVCDARIIMITGRNGIDDCVTALEAGCDDYMQKPLRAEELLLRIERLL